MNLQRVPPGDGHKAAHIRCAHCGVFKRPGAMFADLDGRPFKDYVCDQCAMLKNLRTPDKGVSL